MKYVSFNVAKVIKAAGYPQELIKHDISYNCNGYLCNEYNANGSELYARPLYLDVWIWLWKEKGIYIDIAHYYSSDEVSIWDKKYNKIKSIDSMGKYNDPEEIILTAIEYLVENNLIK